MKNNNFVAKTVYNSAIEHELEWRKNKDNKHDVELLENLIKEVNNLGYSFKYEADFLYREIKDNRFFAILKKYIGKFDNEGISANLLGSLSYLTNSEIVEYVLERITVVKNMDVMNRKMNLMVCDNLLNNYRNKNHIAEYLQILNDIINAENLPLTMLMLAKWKVKEAKPLFIKYLNEADSLKFTAIEALVLYKDSSIIPLLKPLLSSSNKNIVSHVKKAISSLKKYS